VVTCEFRAQGVEAIGVSTTFFQLAGNGRWHGKPVCVESLEEFTMMLTAEQMQAIQNGEPVPVTAGHTECVLVRKDRFRAAGAVTYDAGDWTEEELSAVAEQMFDELDHAEKIP